jgi:iron(III) transport system permease protein
MSITFVYTVLLMIIMGLTMFLVYGRSGGGRKRRPRFGGTADAPAGHPVSPDAATPTTVGADAVTTTAGANPRS